MLEHLATHSEESKVGSTAGILYKKQIPNGVKMNIKKPQQQNQE